VQKILDGRAVGYDDSGGGGVPLVLIHGFGYDRRVWDPVVALLPAIRSIQIDLRGCGESARGDGPALMESLAGDVAALLDALGVDRAVIAGHSLGGFVAFAYFRMYAERVAALGILASSARADTPEAAARREAFASRLEADGTMASTAGFAHNLVSPAIAAARPEVLAQTVAMLQRQDALGAAQLLRGMQVRVSSDDLLADVAVPTLVLYGTADTMMTSDIVRELADGIADATVVALDGVGHTLPLEAPGPVAEALAALVALVARAI
jgi:pimeloyl-ACP methyl ester carboxylesterase